MGVVPKARPGPLLGLTSTGHLTHVIQQNHFRRAHARIIRMAHGTAHALHRVDAPSTAGLNSWKTLHRRRPGCDERDLCV